MTMKAKNRKTKPKGKLRNSVPFRGVKRCRDCGFKIRGPEHEKGIHHRDAKKVDAKGNKILVGPFAMRRRFR